MRIGSIIIFPLTKLWKVKFSILCDVIFLVGMQGKFEIDHSYFRLRALQRSSTECTHATRFWNGDENDRLVTWEKRGDENHSDSESIDDNKVTKTISTSDTRPLRTSREIPIVKLLSGPCNLYFRTSFLLLRHEQVQFQTKSHDTKKWDPQTIVLLTLSFPRVINIKFLLQPHQKYYITQYGELGFS